MGSILNACFSFCFKGPLADCRILVRQCPGCFIHFDPEATIFFAGRRGAGKTSLMNNLHLGINMDPTKRAILRKSADGGKGTPKTVGYNFEVITFNQTKYYQLIDPSGSEAMMQLWPTFWDSVYIDYVVYVIDMTEFLKQRTELDRYEYLRVDREQITRILNHPKLDLREAALPKQKDGKMELKDVEKGLVDTRVDCRLIVYLNFKGKEEPSLRRLAQSLLIDALRLDEEASLLHHGDTLIPMENYITSLKELMPLINVKEDDEWVQGICFGRNAGWRTFFYRY